MNVDFCECEETRCIFRGESEPNKQKVCLVIPLLLPAEYTMLIFTESALRPIQSVSRDVRLSLCLSVRHTLETTLPKGLETSGRRAYR